MRHLFTIALVILVSSVSVSQETEEPKKVTYGLTLNGGGNSTNSIGESIAPTYGLGALMKISITSKAFHIIRLDYNIKQEHFADLKHYYWQDGRLIESRADVYKNYGILNLNYSLNYFLYAGENISLFASGGLGINDLFWIRSRVEVLNSEDEITNGKTQFLYTNPLTRPSFNAGFGLLLPYENDKLIAFKPEINYDYRLPFSKNTYPNFLSFTLRIMIFF